MAYKNYLEDIVEGELDTVLSQLNNVCACARCREDMVAYTLNRLAPKYVVTSVGQAYTKLNQLKVQARADIIVQLMAAVQVVRNKPRH